MAASLSRLKVFIRDFTNNLYKKEAFDEVTMQVCLSGSYAIYGILNLKTFNCSTQNTEYQIRKQAIFVDLTSTFPFMKKAGLEFHKRFFYATLVKLHRIQ